VLLVIFIVTAPFIGASLKLDLPKSDAARPNDAPAFVAISVDAQGRLFLGNEAATPEAVAERVREAAARNPDTEVQLRADQAVPYGRVAELIGLVQQGGLSRIGFVTETPSK
jgi:biopolymer transport protein ExbD